MDFRMPDKIMRWLGPAIIFAIGGCLIIGNPISVSVLCDNTNNCLATWVAALSGWAALVGALATVGVMTQQLRETRRQTTHLMGDGRPDIYAHRSHVNRDGDIYPTLIISVVNRNRRPLELYMLSVEKAEVTLGILSSKVRNETVETVLSTEFPSLYIHRTVPGKEDGQPADICAIECSVRSNEGWEPLDESPEYWELAHLNINVQCYLKGAVDENLVLNVTASVDY